MLKEFSWKSKGLSTEIIVTPTTTDNSLSVITKSHGNWNFCLTFKESCLKQKQKNNFYTSTYNNFFIVYELDTQPQDLNADFTLKDCLFGGIKLAKSADLEKCCYSEYDIGFDFRSLFSYWDFDWGKNVHHSSSVHTDIKKKDLLVPGERPTQGLNDTMIMAEAKYSINFSKWNRKFCLSLFKLNFV